MNSEYKVGNMWLKIDNHELEKVESINVASYQDDDGLFFPPKIISPKLRIEVKAFSATLLATKCQIIRNYEENIDILLLSSKNILEVTMTSDDALMLNLYKKFAGDCPFDFDIKPKAPKTLWVDIEGVNVDSITFGKYSLGKGGKIESGGLLWGYGGTVAASPQGNLKKLLPGLDEPVDCPECGAVTSVWYAIQHRNDVHAISREAIADWLETLDVDLTFPIGEESDEQD